MERSDLNEVARTIYGFIKYIPNFYTDDKNLADFGKRIKKSMEMLIPLPIKNPVEYPIEWYERSKRILEKAEIKQNKESNYSKYLDKLRMQLSQILVHNKGAGLEATTHDVEMVLCIFLKPENYEQYVTILKEKLEKIVSQKLQNKEPLTEQDIRFYENLIEDKLQNKETLTEQETEFYRILIEKKKETGERLTEQEQKFYKESKQENGQQKTIGSIDKKSPRC